jgi:hypothetical protein
VLLNDPKTDAQTQPRAFADRFRCIERIEHAMRLLDAGPSVGK